MRTQTPKTQTKNKKWIAFREEEVAGVFENRREAVKWIKSLLNQTLKDLDKQSKNDDYDYSILISRYKLIPINEREKYLGL